MRQTRMGQLVIAACRRSAGISKISNRQLVAAFCGVAVLLLCNFTGGCSGWFSKTGSQQSSFEEMLAAPYNQTILRKSLTLDVLPKIQRLQGELAPHFMGAELLSQGENVVASSGQTEDGRRIWFNMVAFHERGFNAIRKYFFLVDDREPTMTGKPRRGLRFACEMVLPEEVLGRSYADENAKQIAIFRHILESLRSDMSGLSTPGSTAGRNVKTLGVCSMLINQTFQIILRELDSSPALVAGLSRAEGVELDHITFDKGVVRMVAGGDTAAARIDFGTFAPQAGGK